ncbi:MAG: TonB-dependent receptor [Sphingobacteriales bacterium]|nr:MAG: TonB-dependent receptor [Sphingobacteriales bacterium]
MKLARRFRYLIYGLMFSNWIAAQSVTGLLKGKVILADGNPAVITLTLQVRRLAVVTDNKGFFSMELAGLEPDTLLIHTAESRWVRVPIAPDGRHLIDLGIIRLDMNITQLQDIEIIGRRTHSYKSDYSYLGTKFQSDMLGIPQSISSITKELIQDKMQLSLKEAAEDAAGVNAYSGFEEYSIRGFKAENAHLINGLRGYNSKYTSPMLVNIERIEVVKGPSATLYGNCDPGGTINLITKKPLDKTEGTFSVGGGSWNHFRSQVDVTGPLVKNKKWLYRINAGYDDTKSYRSRLFAKSYEVAPSLSFIPNEHFKLNVDYSVSHIKTVLDRGQPGFDNDFNLNATPISLMMNQANDELKETVRAMNMLLTYRPQKRFSFNSGFLHYVIKQDNEEHGIHSYITPDSVNLYFTKWSYHTITNTFTNYFTFRFNTGKPDHHLVGGYDITRSKVELQQEYYERADLFGIDRGVATTLSLKNPRYPVLDKSRYTGSDYDSDYSDVEPTRYTTQGIYLQDQIHWNKLQFLLGLKEEIYEADEKKSTAKDDKEYVFLPRIGIVYQPRANYSLYATWNNGFDPFEASASTQVFRDPFKPVTSEVLETGIKANLFKNKLTASLSVYRLTLHHVAVNANDIANPDLFIQQGVARSAGVEAEANGKLLPDLSIAVSYAFCNAKLVEAIDPSQSGKPLENAPKHSSNTWMKYTFSKGPLKGFSISAGHTQVSSRNTLTAGLRLPGYLLLHVGIQFTRKKFTLSVILNNLTDKTYWLSAYNNVSKWPGAPRNVMTGLTFRF